MVKRLVYFNGEFVPEPEARISIFDCALMYGDMVFEMTRSFGQKPYRLREHLERLYGSLKYAQIDCGLDIDAMEEATHETIARNLPAIGALDFQIMHDVTRGALPLYDTIVKEGMAPIVSINVFPLVRHIGAMAHLYQQGGAFRRPASAVGTLALHRPQSQKPQPYLLQDRRVAGRADGGWCASTADRRTRLYHRGNRQQLLYGPRRPSTNAPKDIISCAAYRAARV